MAGVDSLLKEYGDANASAIGSYQRSLESSLQALQGYREEYGKRQVSRSKRLAELSKEIGEISIAKEEELLTMRQNLNAMIEQENNEYLKKYGSVLNDKAIDVLRDAANINVPTFASIMLGYEAARQSAADREEKHLNRQMEVYKRIEEIARQKADLEARRAENERADKIAEIQAQNEIAKQELEARNQAFDAQQKLGLRILDSQININSDAFKANLKVMENDMEQQRQLEVLRATRELQAKNQSVDRHTQMVNDFGNIKKAISEGMSDENISKLIGEFNIKYTEEERDNYRRNFVGTEEDKLVSDRISAGNAGNTGNTGNTGNKKNDTTGNTSNAGNAGNTNVANTNVASTNAASTNAASTNDNFLTMVDNLLYGDNNEVIHNNSNTGYTKGKGQEFIENSAKSAIENIKDSEPLEVFGIGPLLRGIRNNMGGQNVAYTKLFQDQNNRKPNDEERNWFNNLTTDERIKELERLYSIASQKRQLDTQLQTQKQSEQQSEQQSDGAPSAMINSESDNLYDFAMTEGIYKVDEEMV